MRKLIAGLASLVAVVCAAPAAAEPLWSSQVTATEQVASSPVLGGGYPNLSGPAPTPGTCRAGMYNSNRSESWIAVRPGTENLVGTSKFFFENFSTYYNFHLGSYTILNGVPAGNNQVQGYDCISTGTQAMPPSWTNNTDPNVDFDSRGRAYQVTLPFNVWWANLHPNAAVMVSYTDDLGRHWVTGNGGRPLEESPNASSKQFGHVEDKQWIAVDGNLMSPFRDRVYAMWAVFNGSAIKVNYAISVDRGQTFTKKRTLTAPSQVGPGATYVYPTVGVDGTVYVSVVSFPPNGGSSSIYVTSSRDGGATWAPFVEAVPNVGVGPARLPNTRFRDGIVEHFAASETYPGRAYLAWEDWDGQQMDVYLSYTLDYGLTWSEPQLVNDNANPTATDQFQPSVAAGAGNAVAVAFYDRRAACPSDPSIWPADVGRTNFCIDTSLQVYREVAGGLQRLGANIRVSHDTWDPEQPLQYVGGLRQDACASHNTPCTTVFIGDYFGLAISAGNIYTLAVSTHYPAVGVTADGGGPVYYQQQVLGTVTRAALGL